MLTATVPPPVAAEVRPAEVVESVEAPGLPAIATAAGLEQKARLDGFVEGFPAHLPDQARDIDAKMVKRLRCPACHARKMECRPYHRMKVGLPYGYRIVAACVVCPAGEVV